MMAASAEHVVTDAPGEPGVNAASSAGPGR